MGNENLGIPTGLVSVHTLQEWSAAAKRAGFEADRYSREYMAKRPAIVEKLKDMMARQGGQDFNLRTALANNWTLNDLQDSYTWHRREQNRLNTAIAAQVALRQLMRDLGMI